MYALNVKLYPTYFHEYHTYTYIVCVQLLSTCMCIQMYLFADTYT